MKASDKICVAPHQIFDYDLDIQEVGHNGAEEYIRKDALVEWAKANLQDRDNWNEKSAADAFWEVIDRLNSL